MVKVEPAASAKMKKKELVESEEEEEVVMKEEEEEEVVGGGGGGLEEYCQPSHTPFPPLGRPLLHSTQHSLKSGVRIRIGSVFNGLLYPDLYSMDPDPYSEYRIRMQIQVLGQEEKTTKRINLFDDE